MAFYSSVHHVYDQIFPLNKQQINFVLEEIKEGADLLDIGCATGNLAIELAKKGFHLNAFDLDVEMIALAKHKLNSEVVNFRVGNMLNISADYPSSEFDGVMCFGNTIVHLTKINLIEDFISAVYSILKKGGKFLFQILNYDYILKENITQLPVIENDKIKFVRKYEFMENGLLNFITCLTVKENNQVVDNQIELLAIKKNEIIRILTEKGFSDIHAFASFSKDKLTETNLPLVFSVTK